MCKFDVSSQFEVYFKEVLRDMDNAGIPHNFDDVVAVHYMRGKINNGKCRRVKNGDDVHYTILVSKHLTDEYDIKSVMAHELLHTSCWEHDELFWRFEDKLHDFNNKYLRLYGGRRNNESDRCNVRPQSKYNVICEDCGKTWNFHRYTRLIDVLTYKEKHSYSCPYCKGHNFKVIQNF